MKSVKLASAAVALVLSTGANSAIISYGGYTHDTDTDIVTGYGLEWLQWDLTVGHSINSIQSQLNTLDGGGWTVASNVQMAQLFNAFDFGMTFDTDENTQQILYTGITPGDPGTEPDELFISMFGDTYTAGFGSSCYLGECVQASQAFFGRDLDGDGRINTAIVFDDTWSNGGNYDAYTILRHDAFPTSSYGASYGIALVREASPVPVPAGVWLFGSGLLGLIGVARRKTRA